MDNWKGTKGEWVAEPRFMDAVNQYTWSIDDKNESAEGLAIVYSGTNDFSDEFYATAEANAKLIASAPELLKALQRCLLSMGAHPDCEEGSEFGDIVSKGWEVIDKATGE